MNDFNAVCGAHTTKLPSLPDSVHSTTQNGCQWDSEKVQTPRRDKASLTQELPGLRIRPDVKSRGDDPETMSAPQVGEMSSLGGADTFLTQRVK